MRRPRWPLPAARPDVPPGPMSWPAHLCGPGGHGRSRAS